MCSSAARRESNCYDTKTVPIAKSESYFACSCIRSSKNVYGKDSAVKSFLTKLPYSVQNFTMTKLVKFNYIRDGRVDGFCSLPSAVSVCMSGV